VSIAADGHILIWIGIDWQERGVILEEPVHPRPIKNLPRSLEGFPQLPLNLRLHPKFDLAYPVLLSESESRR